MREEGYCSVQILKSALAALDGWWKIAELKGVSGDLFGFASPLCVS
jgi:hypothetical protein